MARKIEEVDLFTLRYYACEDALAQERIRGLDEQENHLVVVQALIRERRAVQQSASKEIQQKLTDLGETLEQKYGVEQNQINWETGEINTVPEATTEEVAGTRTGPDERVDEAAGTGSADESAPSGSPRTEAPYRGRTEDPGPVVG